MLPRKLEPEVMDTKDEAIDYDAMNHGDVNRSFVDDFLFAVGDRDPNVMLSVLDLGTGTAQIPVELCRRSIDCRVTAVDLAAEMLKVAKRNVAAAELEDRILLEQIDAKRLTYADESFDAVISNSIVHHIPEPASVVTEMLRVLRRGGLLFVRDLLRPASIDHVAELVETYASGANTHQRQMFHDSLCAALTLEEIQKLLADLGAPTDWASQTTDRHWTICGRKS